MQAIWPLGNDIVDLRLPDNLASAANRRYVERVIATEERDASSLITDCNRVFWAYWAAKESAYKALVRIEPGLVFAYRRFLVYPDPTDSMTSDHGVAKGVARHGNWSIPVSWEWNNDWVHCLTGNELDHQFCRIGALEHYTSGAAFRQMQQATGDLPDASVVTRLLAQSLLHDQGVDDVQIVRAHTGKRRGPPRLERQGKPIKDIDISLSHDGRYAAAAIRILASPS